MESKITRRTMLRRTATLTTGVLATGSTTFAVTTAASQPTKTAHDHDSATDEISDHARDRRWDTV